MSIIRIRNVCRKIAVCAITAFLTIILPPFLEYFGILKEPLCLVEQILLTFGCLVISYILVR